MRLCKKLEIQMYLGFWLERWGSVCQFPIAPHIALLIGLAFSLLPSTDFADTKAFSSGSEKELHHQCRETQPIQTCEFSRDRMLCPCCLSRE